MRIAIEGCAHGDLEVIYNTLTYVMQKHQITIDLLICCGDFQCPRNETDMKCMSMPEKYLSMGSFWKYYSGQLIAPIPTIFIHGNHECVNFLKELYFGGWVAPNIYYMGYSGVVNFGGVRIGGMSGIFNEHNYQKGHFERPPYVGSSSKSSYHVREYEVLKLSHIKEHVDIFVSHDWPRGIYHFGDKQQLLRCKPLFRSEIENNELGSVAAQHVMLTLKPSYWFSAHLHVKFAAQLPHPDNIHVTKFLALDKCIPGRDFLQIIEIDENQTQTAKAGHKLEKAFYYDEEWISILKASMPLYNTSNQFVSYPGTLSQLEESRNQLKQMLKSNSTQDSPQEQETQPHDPESLRIPLNFQMTVVPYDPTNPSHMHPQGKMAAPFDNHQTIEFCSKFGISLPNQNSTDHSQEKKNLETTSSEPQIQPAQVETALVKDPNEIDLDAEF